MGAVKRTHRWSVLIGKQTKAARKYWQRRGSKAWNDAVERFRREVRGGD